MATLAERCRKAGLNSAAELTRITGTSKETLTNWMKDKPLLFETVLKGAVSKPETVKDDFDKSKSEYIDYLYLKDNYAALKAKLAALEEKEQHVQTWAFSQEDLQEQARLLERLTTENERLKAELQLARKSHRQPKSALIGKRFKFIWHSEERIIERTSKGWLFINAGTNKPAEVTFVNDSVINHDGKRWTIDLKGDDGVIELTELSGK